MGAAIPAFGMAAVPDVTPGADATPVRTRAQIECRFRSCFNVSEHFGSWMNAKKFYRMCGPGAATLSAR